MRERIKLFIYALLPIPHWWMWPVKAGDNVWVDGCGFGQCMYVNGNYRSCCFGWTSKIIVLHKSDVLYAYPEGDLPRI